MAKRLVSLLMAVMLIVGIFVVPAIAAQDDSGIMPRGPVCMKCQGNCTVTTSTVWRATGNKVSCKHGLNGYDEYTKEVVITKTVCDKCGDKRTSERETGQQIRVCYGYK